MPIVADGWIGIGKRMQTGEVILDVFPQRTDPPVSVRTPHVEAATLPDALRRLADVIDAHNTENSPKEDT